MAKTKSKTTVCSFCLGDFPTKELYVVEMPMHRLPEGGHVGEYMEYLQEEDNTKYQQQFAAYIENDIEPDGLEELYEGVHEKIREDPSPSEKKEFTPDKSFKRKAKKTLEEFKADVQAKKDAKNEELAADDDE